ncbi:hypothetical protein SAMN04488028_1011069 [Reichenbachiella agariperforans]|uniref:Uncharacterized protein n=1 Tax=Reichenbachiella agariperforans TaxID=156994 RepID=A0A1M6LRR6_REIAG|nr:hypothetical protein SAMN04488028_1011069 [Reichenbachiella agariperforans]
MQALERGLKQPSPLWKLLFRIELRLLVFFLDFGQASEAYIHAIGLHVIWVE